MTMKPDSGGEFTCPGCEECGMFKLTNQGLYGEGMFLSCLNCGGLIEIEIINEHASRAPADDERDDDSGLISVASWPTSDDPRSGG